MPTPATEWQERIDLLHAQARALLDDLSGAPLDQRLAALARLEHGSAELYGEALRQAAIHARHQGWGLRRIGRATDRSHEQIRILTTQPDAPQPAASQSDTPPRAAAAPSTTATAAPASTSASSATTTATTSGAATAENTAEAPAENPAETTAAATASTTTGETGPAADDREPPPGPPPAPRTS
ncbi:hypothetical protein [Streptomyces spiramenti]|uniref:DUF222 domain-containing protein n=1 Tax=Streptomyces spiramenti TaxID=2720606 RepID=A0ABX1AJX9_9ACTN|nr:hypothetical protein [Streptomyces spiramenti]NJP65683.1 hypothetical protein [Streptomyces spiramenti]